MRKAKLVLDLVIKAAIAKSHDISIQIKSELGQGSTFTIKILSVFCWNISSSFHNNPS
ncbi:hypothetical protein [Phormidium tenue]|uniref:Uncharacterized protein n=1 Tax=Phormidium tenue FACHB-1050 TaxID=2692857 RepID=A0ABR8CAF0_9CYAN|nr:hypothetical protein [Phormidium tenue]MBD2316394.1 hypothetical protein [Phormidium tenue FACHB-1050]